MNQMVIGATLQGKPAWFTIENKYDSPGKWELTTSKTIDGLLCIIKTS